MSLAGCQQRVKRRESKTDSYGKRPTLFGLRCILCHNFWTNYDLDLFCTSKWPSNHQFCERYRDSCQKMTRNCRKMIGKTADSLLCPLHSIQFSPLEFLPLRSYHALVHNFMGFFAPDAEKRPDLTIEVCICCLIV